MKDLRFPRVRTVLWDRSNQGPPIHIHVSSFRKPQVCVSVSGLHVIKQHAASSLDSQRITLYANVVYDKDGQRVSIMVDTADEAKGSDENKVMPIQVPILISKSKKCVFPPEDYTKAVKNVFVHCGSSDPVELGNFFSVLGKCFDQKCEGGLLETYLEFDVITAVTQIKVVPINSVPIMLTALSKDLASPMGWSNLHGQSRSGYITMDHARKLVLMVDSDPKIFTLPLIGIWVSGVESVCHPFVWASCLRYLCNSNLQQRVCLPPNPFILVLYSRLHTKPDFYECNPLNADVKLHQMEIYCGFKPVHLGYTQDLLTVELNLLKYGIKKDKIDAVASRMVKAPGSKVEPVSSSDEMMPRSIPTPHQSKIPEAKFDVPEVSIIFSDSGNHPNQTGSMTVSCPTLTTSNFQHPPTLLTPANCSSYTRMENSAVVSTTPSTTHQQLQQGNKSLPLGYPTSQNLQLKGYNSQPTPHPPLAQSAQLRDLKAQVQQLKLSQTCKSVSDPSSQSTISTGVGTSLCDDTGQSLKSDKQSTVAVNTSFQYPARTPSPVEKVATVTVSLQTSPVKFLPSQSDQHSPVIDSSQKKIFPLTNSTESRPWHFSQNQNGSFSATMPDMSHEDLSAVARRLSVDQRSMDSFQSEMVVDLPSYQTSLFRSTESANIDRLPSLSSSHSLVSASMCANMQHHTDSERDTDDDDDTGHGNPQVLPNKPECYEQLINNVKQLLQREDPEENAPLQDTESDMTKDSPGNENYLANETSRIRDDSLLFADESCHRSELNLVDCTFVPKINYTSMLLDSDTETSLEINSLALKYLKDDQLTQIAKLHKQEASSARPLCQNVLLRQIMRNNPDTSGADISKYGMCVNNLTFATRKYMEKHHLIESDSKNNQRIIQDSTETNSLLQESEQDGSYPNIFGTLSPSPPLACRNNKDRPQVAGPLAGVAAGTVLPCNRFQPLSKSTPVLKPFPKIDSSPMENVFVPIQSPTNEELDTENRILDIAKLKQLPKLL
ncbi:STIL [Acanthosepion pharaonis]|uniref:STIL n=1 Tax=Acanthosepion pharaonis TaxID=158019 RepID=A0A812E5N1_ACAPH|nr:STIL [Sepia pharaonis]